MPFLFWEEDCAQLVTAQQMKTISKTWIFIYFSVKVSYLPAAVKKLTLPGITTDKRIVCRRDLLFFVFDLQQFL